jgi:hypothetical protein
LPDLVCQDFSLLQPHVLIAERQHFRLSPKRCRRDHLMVSARTFLCSGVRFCWRKVSNARWYSPTSSRASPSRVRRSPWVSRRPHIVGGHSAGTPRGYRAMMEGCRSIRE